jgi:hypothetical protein
MDTSTSSSTGTGTSIATIGDVIRQAQRRADAAGTQQSDLAKWLIIAAAVFGAMMLMRGVRSMMRIVFALFWVWFWTHGAWRYIF